jgi:hypothetical protein
VPKREEGEIPHKPAGEGRSGSNAQKPGGGKLVKVAMGGKLQRRRGKTTSHVSCK